MHKGYIDNHLRLGLKAQPIVVKLLDIEGLQRHCEWLMNITFITCVRKKNFYIFM